MVIPLELLEENGIEITSEFIQIRDFTKIMGMFAKDVDIAILVPCSGGEDYDERRYDLALPLARKKVMSLILMQPFLL